MARITIAQDSTDPKAISITHTRGGHWGMTGSSNAGPEHCIGAMRFNGEKRSVPGFPSPDFSYVPVKFRQPTNAPRSSFAFLRSAHRRRCIGRYTFFHSILPVFGWVDADGAHISAKISTCSF
ncbi:hypothetical protein [Novosphingobium sp.]|uniref:hypothetical protein n=1 Tax=Novosphingobium sp. TaxID=1874826 RepID=UPI0033408755